jgi:alpha-tubulin suppressor-like RCC1 family protein
MRNHLSPALFFSLVALSGAALSAACSSSDPQPSAETDGGSGTGGGSGSGGRVNTAGADANGAGESGAGNDEGGGAGSTNAGGSDPGTGGDPGDGEGVAGAATGVETLPSTTATVVASGRLHSCAITAGGAVRCWGYSNVGQLGNGADLDDVSFGVPVAVEGLNAGVTALSTSSDHTCAVVSGKVKCWGLNDKHQLVGDSTDSSALPLTVAGLTGITAISAGANHTCALTAAGGVKCWGQGDSGQLGDDTAEDSGTPVDVKGLSAGVTAIAAGRYHSCAVTAGGGVKCWGSNNYGELGNDSTDASHVPVAVTGLGSGVLSVAAGDSTTCIITSAGAAKCWGKNADGQLGNGESGTQVHSQVAVDVTGLTTGVTSITTGYDFSCAVVGGAAKCWGDNYEGVIGNGQGPGYSTAKPVAVTGLTKGVTSLAASAHHVCALVGAGAVKCWGLGGGGELGVNNLDDSNVPVAVLSLP